MKDDFDFLVEDKIYINIITHKKSSKKFHELTNQHKSLQIQSCFCLKKKRYVQSSSMSENNKIILSSAQIV